ncbi:MAG: hypothetical protein ABI856_20030, partial [Nitrospira sp.]
HFSSVVLRMDKALHPYLLFWSIGLLFFMAEWLYPARPIAYRSVLWRDLLALAAYNLSFLLVFNGRTVFQFPTIFLPLSTRYLQ